MSALLFFLLGMLSVLVQSTLVRGSFLHPFTPDTILLIVIYASFSLPHLRGILLSFALGLLSDLFSGAPEGWNAAYAILVFLLGKGLQARLYFQGSKAAAGLLLIACALKLPFFLIFSPTAHFSFPFEKQVLAVWLGEFAATLLLMPVLFYILSRSLGHESMSYPRKG